jgi:putative membrane protein
MKTIAVLAALLLAACTPEARQHAHPRPVQRPPKPVLHPQDRDFLERASQGSNAEVAMGGLAANRALRPEVRALGGRMLNDHGAINRGLAAIAGKHRIILPTDLGDHQASYDRLVDLHRDHFDREFVQVMVEDHDMAVLLFQGEASGGVDPEIRAFAARTLPLIRAHLQHAKTLKAPLPSVAPQTGETR